MYQYINMSFSLYLWNRERSGGSGRVFPNFCIIFLLPTPKFASRSEQGFGRGRVKCPSLVAATCVAILVKSELKFRVWIRIRFVGLLMVKDRLLALWNFIFFWQTCLTNFSGIVVWNYGLVVGGRWCKEVVEFN